MSTISRQPAMQAVYQQLPFRQKESLPHAAFKSQNQAIPHANQLFGSVQKAAPRMALPHRMDVNHLINVAFGAARHFTSKVQQAFSAKASSVSDALVQQAAAKEQAAQHARQNYLA